MHKALTIKWTLWIIILLLSAENVSANPKGANVVSGQASLVHPSANALTITNSPNAIINWQSFDINPNEITRFIQQNGASAVLNRVVGSSLTASQIMGTLASNGKVFLVNPNGIVFGANSVVDTAGLIASSLNISDQDFLNNNLRFDGNASNGAIDNKGYIKAGLNGDVFLIAPNIENSGIIETNGGHIVLAAGEKVSLASFENENIVFQVQSADNKVTNLGSVITNGGAAEIFAGTITHSGSINANSISVNDAGKVTLASISDINIESNSVITANGNNGGQVHIESDSGDTIVKGSLEANGSTGKGGSIQVLGERVGLFDSALVSANGKTGGGEVLIGGDFQGKNSDIKNAKQTVVGDDAIIKANATDTDDGGKVIVWADDFTDFHGAIEAMGGENTGNGGFVEVSGKNTLSYNGAIDVTALNGQSGNVLFDPKNLTIVDGGADLLNTNNEFAENSTGTSNIDQGAVNTLLDAGTTVTLQASNDLSITDVLSAGGASTGDGGSLVLQAGRSISITANIDTNGGDFNATANSSLADGVINAERDAGDAEFRLGAGTTINTGGGAISIKVSDGAGLTNNGAGDIVLENGADVLGGSIDFDSQGNIDIQQVATIDSNGAAIDLTSQGDIDLDSGAKIESNGGAINVTAAGTLSLKQISAVGSSIDSTGGTGGNIVISADDLDVQTGSSINTSGTDSGNLTIQPFSTNQDISIGTAGSGTPLEITAAELARMLSIDTLTIGRSTDTGTLTIAENLTSAGINASTLILQNQNIVTNNAIDLSAGGKNLELLAWSILDINNAINAGNVTIEAPVATFAPVTTVNIDSFTINGTGTPIATFVGAGTTLFRNSTALNTVIQSAGTIDTSAGQTVTIGGSYAWSGGTIDGSVTANSVTTVTNTVTLNGLFNNNGAFTWSGGNINGTLGGGSGFNNNSGGTFNATGDGTFSQTFTNAGNLSKAIGTGTTTFNGDLTTNSGSVSINSGTLEFDGYTQTAGITILNGGNLTDTSGDGFDFDGGTLKGVGTLTTDFLNINNGATFAPGSSPGTFNVVGALTFSPTSTLLIELGGTTQGTNYDFVNVTGNVALDGTLNVSLFGGFTGIAGNQFDIISSGTNTMTGAFANSIFPAGYTISQGIVGGGSFYQLGLITVPVAPDPNRNSNSNPTNQILVLEENNPLTIDENIFSNTKPDEEYDDQALICT
jgi:filamentous hemagglutinin family protein